MPLLVSHHSHRVKMKGCKCAVWPVVNSAWHTISYRLMRSRLKPHWESLGCSEELERVERLSRHQSRAVQKLYLTLNEKNMLQCCISMYKFGNCNCINSKLTAGQENIKEHFRLVMGLVRKADLKITYLPPWINSQSNTIQSYIFGFWTPS